jgi:putative phage-type endonuclease
MPITQKQRDARHKHLGSTDIAAILGVDPRRNAYDVWLDKTGKIEDSPENEAMFAGNMFEEGVLGFAEGQLGKLVRNQYRSAKDINLPIGAHIDAIQVETGAPVEAKTAGLYGPLVEPWGEPGTDEVPDRVIVQSQVHMICTSAIVCHVAAFIGGRGFQLYEVPQDADLQAIIGDRAIAFWDKHVKADIPPENVTPSYEIAKRIRRQPRTITDISAEFVEAWLSAKVAFSDAKATKENAAAALLAALGSAEAGISTAGNITYYQQIRKAYTVKETEYPVLRFTTKPLFQGRGD